MTAVWMLRMVAERHRLLGLLVQSQAILHVDRLLVRDVVHITRALAYCTVFPAIESQRHASVYLQHHNKLFIIYTQSFISYMALAIQCTRVT